MSNVRTELIEYASSRLIVYNTSLQGFRRLMEIKKAVPYGTAFFQLILSI
jgi:hypothetical protein